MSDAASPIGTADALLRVGPQEIIEKTVRDQPYLFKDPSQYQRILKMIIGRLYRDQILRLESYKGSQSPPLAQIELEQCNKLQAELRSMWMSVMDAINNPKHAEMIAELIRKTNATGPHD